MEFLQRVGKETGGCGGRGYRCGDRRGWYDFDSRSIATRFFNLTATLEDWLFFFNDLTGEKHVKMVEEYFLHPN